MAPRTIWSACLRVDAETNGQVDGLVELGLRPVLHDGDRFFDGVLAVALSTSASAAFLRLPM